MENFGSERMIELLEEERKRMARDIHDGPAQSLTNVTMRLEVTKRMIESGRVSDSVQEIERLQTILRTAINDVRRLIFDLRPTFLEHGLSDAIRLYAERFTQMCGLPVTVVNQWGEPEFTRGAAVAMFRVVQEALNNIHKHAKADQVEIRLLHQDGLYRAMIQDNGRGFATNVNSPTSYGLQGMRERMELVGGRVTVQSEPGKGTLVVCEVPAHHA
ncbi:MAG: sensor histidine kinase [Alicyclobacillus herbarius]|uniref:sensor histidine kinase n=1 Tax=Alicyclobacillus herbarius TaxID=122960 RepID=UPI0023560503|nr:sensor histidine kinase [Alicyclobacillus herbarius]MCL6633862.1 sensor histidine kinase [Alicyclobacillus herbarius]